MIEYDYVNTVHIKFSVTLQIWVAWWWIVISVCSDQEKLDKAPTSFYVIKVDAKPPCMVLRAAFLRGTPGRQRKEVTYIYMSIMSGFNYTYTYGILVLSFCCFQFFGCAIYYWKQDPYLSDLCKAFIRVAVTLCSGQIISKWSHAQRLGLRFGLGLVC